MTKQEYIRQVVKHLQCSRTKKDEIARQLDSDMETALGEGKKLEEIVEEMGMPEALAGEFNENLGQAEKKQRKRRRLTVILTVVLLAVTTAGGFIYWAIPKGRDINESRTFDTARVQECAEEVIRLVSVEDYEALDRCLTTEVRDALKKTSLPAIKQMVGEDWGDFRAIGSTYMTEISQMGRHYAVVQTNVSYENISVVFTLSFDEEMLLYGIYMK